ncbi:MAG TPA: flagellar biosynthesis protein FlhA [Phycisphaerae bacterium]|nr:flagellar biosynthesis protein FlhA [Phycisphaerae bacterium]
MSKAAALTPRKIDVPKLANRAVGMRGLLLPAFALALIVVILTPLPTPLMDLFLVVNITLSAVVMVTVMYIQSPLDFSSFPSLLLAMTLFRLVLNIGTTRLILTNAQAQGELAGGRVIQVFGSFVSSGSLMVAVIIFAIIVIIQFVVITKGATRIAEVAARFTLDGMPGKQMAVDADLNAGAITEAEAKRRRAEITREADFYGAMDGASKFVRGDAIAGIIITVVNILGGLYVGMVELDMGLRDTMAMFTKLTIGDGLVSQIPAFIVSISAAMIVTRSASKDNLGSEVLGQVGSQPVALIMASIFLGVLTFTPLPKVPLIMLGASTGTIAFLMRRNTARVAAETEAREKARAATGEKERPETYLTVDALGLEVGYGLIKLVDRKQGGDLLDRITNLRRQIAQDLGIVVPPIRIRDNIQLQPNQYSVKLKGIEIARGEAVPGHLLAIDSGAVTDPIHGIETREPAFGLPALWVREDQRQQAEVRHYTVVPPTSVMATHLTELIKRHGDELLTRTEVNRLLDNLKERSPKLIEEIVPAVLKPGEIQAVLQTLLRERVPIRDLETIVETMGDWAPRTREPEILTEYVRHALARTICQLHRNEKNRINCLTLDPALEELIGANVQSSEGRSLLALAPALQRRIVDAVRKAVEAALPASGGATPVLLCAPQIRPWMRRMIEATLEQVAVLSYNEIVRDVELESRGMVVLDEETANHPG